MINQINIYDNSGMSETWVPKHNIQNLYKFDL